MVYTYLVKQGGFSKASDLKSAIGFGSRSTAVFEEHMRPCTFALSEHDGYRLCGWPNTLQPPMSSNVHEPSRQYTVKGEHVQITLTQSAATRVKPSAKIIYLPTPLDKLIGGDFSDEANRWPNIRVESGRVYQLAPIAEAMGVMPGSAFRLELNLDSRSYSIVDR
jgi:hypothetical protein